MAEDVDKVERARLACEEIIDHMHTATTARRITCSF